MIAAVIFLAILAIALTNQQFRTGLVRFILSPLYAYEQRSHELKLWRDGKRGVMKDTPINPDVDAVVRVTPRQDAESLIAKEQQSLWPKFLFGRVLDVEHGVATILRSEQAYGEVYLPAPPTVSKGDFVAYILEGPRQAPQFYQVMGDKK
jgi:hypothetical protein